ncbi:MAG: 23S rRNA (uridine(2552)-2'-O)-methyltransferase RlmE [Gammaproteobacteria bacterium]|nr:23S rRNA (uridine(2552)-2'-O)-methyltransferase RlmE [Gammaproteobacteria bacterium]MCP5417066.1 23S rRNA (uridine(2552)-2'-O)-methyltransferase RlmE [Chromatiaceae bacterium]
MKKSKSSRQWLDRHFRDEYVKRAQVDGYRSRAAYKLLEIQGQDKLFRPGQVVVDLGAAPGGWSQVAKRLVGASGRVVALDLLSMEPLDGVIFLQGDFREQEPLDRLRAVLQGDVVDLVLSDMAPNVSGVSAVDQPKSIYLCEIALDFAKEVLRPGGSMLIKVFQGEGFDHFVRELRNHFTRVQTRKPSASRPKSREVYLVAGNFNL